MTRAARSELVGSWLSLCVGLLLYALLAGCASGGGVKPPVPNPAPTPTPTPEVLCPPGQIKVCTADVGCRCEATMPPLACLAVQSFKLKLCQPPDCLRRVLDATPGHGFVNSNFQPLGPEGTADRIRCEEEAGPYAWTVDGRQCNEEACDRGGNCFRNGGNPLQIIVCRPGGQVEVRAANGAASAMRVAFP